jgi:hypothetical protein
MSGAQCTQRPPQLEVLRQRTYKLPTPSEARDKEAIGPVHRREELKRLPRRSGLREHDTKARQYLGCRFWGEFRTLSAEARNDRLVLVRQQGARRVDEHSTGADPFAVAQQQGELALAVALQPLRSQAPFQRRGAPERSQS